MIPAEDTHNLLSEPALHPAPHWPWEGPADTAFSKSIEYSRDGFRAGESIKVYAEMMKNLDDGIGRVLAALKTSGLERNTLVIFTSDNGGERFHITGRSRVEKMETSARAAFVSRRSVRWPGVTRAGTVTDQPAITMDWTATMVAAAGRAGSRKYPMDGEDVTSVLSGKRPAYDRTFSGELAAREQCRGKWKYLRDGKNEFLFDLSVE